MANVRIHPVLRKKLERRRLELETLIKRTATKNFNLYPPAYRENTARNAAACGVSILEMHGRGVANVVELSRKELAEIDGQLENS